jgi:quercetin dioxygenase-like cupin family protein
VRILDFSVGRELPEPLLENATVAPLTAPLARGASFQAAVFRLGPGGRIARHPASVPPLLAVVEGAGRVSGREGGQRGIRAGEAAYWDVGEEHETTTEQGLTAVIIEGEGLAPYSSAAATT